MRQGRGDASLTHMSHSFWFAFSDTLLARAYTEADVLKEVKKVAWLIEVLRHTEAVDFPFWHYRETLYTKGEKSHGRTDSRTDNGR